jgi:hypothetical protein
MRNRGILLLAVIAGLSAATTASAMYVFQPANAVLSELPHEKYFTWGIDFTPKTGETITDATLTFTNIWDWTTEKNDHLFTHLLDNPRSGLRSFTDNQKGGDNFAGKGVLVGNWSDQIGGQPRNFDLVYDFKDMGLLDELTAYIATTPGRGKANIGFGIDPDCHYFNSGVTFTIITDDGIHTSPVPEPAAIVLLGFGMSFVRRLSARRPL